MSEEIQGTVAETVPQDIPEIQEGAEPVVDQGEVDPNPAETPEEPVDKKDPWYKRRIDELTREKHEARRYAERLEKLLDSQPQQRNPQPEAPQIQPPKPEDFAGGMYDPRYIQAQMEYVRASAIEEAKHVVAQEYEQRMAYQKQQEATARLEAAEAAARAKFADYDVVIEGITQDPRLAQNPIIRQAVLGSQGPDIAYVLGKNLDVAYEIAQLDPISAGMRLAEVMNRAPRKSANAPTPIRPISQAGSTPVRKSTSEMTTDEFIAYRNAQELEARKARINR
jgi:hypothetical protein